MLNLLPNTLPCFDQRCILVVGDVMLDRYWFGDTMRISPEAPVPVVKVTRQDNRPGGAANVALNLAALGIKVILLGITGVDEEAHILEQQLANAGVLPLLRQCETTATIVKLRVVSRHQQLLRLDFEQTEEPPTLNSPLLLDDFKKYLPQADLVILSDYQKGTLAAPQSFIQLARQSHIPVLIDPKNKHFDDYRQASILTPNLKEFEAVAGTCRSEEDLLHKGKTLLEKYELDSLLITRGEAGMTLVTPAETLHIPAYSREVFDVTGAGDTVIGVLGAGLAAKMPLKHAVALANLAAGIAVSKLGAATVSSHELEAALDGHIRVGTGIINEEQLLQAVKQARAQGKKIVFTNGCFDILHAGHVACLQLAKQYGDYLIVAVNTDESIRQLKGPHRPINHLEHRMTVLAGLGVVDWVVPFNDATPERLLQLIQPEFLVKGGDYQPEQVVGANIVRAYGGEVRIMQHGITASSSALIQQLQEKSKKEEVP